MMTVSIILVVTMVALIVVNGVLTYRQRQWSKQLAELEARYYRMRMREDGLDPWGDE